MATEAQNLSREMAHAYLTGTGPRTNRLSSPASQGIVSLIMQNKPNLLHTQMDLSSVKTKHYENNRPRKRPKNKPNQTQSKSRPLHFSPLSEVPARRGSIGDLSGTHPLHEIRDTLHETRPPPRPTEPISLKGHGNMSRGFLEASVFWLAESWWSLVSQVCGG